MRELFSINPSRLEWCLRDFGLALGELSLAVGVAEKTLESALEGLATVSYGQLEKLANFFGRGVLFFIDPSPVTDDRIHTPQFRTLQNKKPYIDPELRKLIERAEWQREIYLGILSESTDIDFPAYDFPDYRGLTAIEAGIRARAWLGLDNVQVQNIDSYREALEKKGILVFRAQGYVGKWHWNAESPILGFSLFFEQFPVIVLRRAEWETQQAFTLIHELGHLILHRAGSIDGAEDFRSHESNEAQANQFAGQVLVPDIFLDQIDDASHPDEVSALERWVSVVTRKCGVSTDVVLIRLIDTGRVTQSEYDEYREWRERTTVISPATGGNRQYRYREPIHIFGDRYVRTVLGALNERLITIPKACSYLDKIKLNDIKKLERYYAGV